MPRTITAHVDDIAAICKRFGVARLEAFGSATTESFEEDSSGFDFIVEFRSGVDLGP